MIILAVLTISPIISIQGTDGLVTSQDLENYALALINEYDKTVSEYFGGSQDAFPFYSNGVYNIQCYVSNHIGVALWFEPSKVYSFKMNYVSDRLETALFGGSFLTWAAIDVENATGSTISGINFVLNGHPFIQINEFTSIVLRDVGIVQPDFQQNFTYVVIKGSNQTRSWSSDNAKVNAQQQVYDDMGVVFTLSEEVKERYAEPELYSLLQVMINKWQDTDQQYLLSDFNADLKNVENIARTKYHILNPDPFINGIIDYLNQRSTGIMPTIAPSETSILVTPTANPDKLIFNQKVDDPYNIMYILCMGFSPLIDLIWIMALANYRKTNKPIMNKLVLGSIPAFLSFLFIPDLLYFRPYDLSILQLVVIILMLSMGTLIVSNKRKKLSNLFTRKKP
jgi:hypothetical protein